MNWPSGRRSQVAEREVLALSQEMTISRADFLRCLPAAVDDAPFRVDGDAIHALDAHRRWRIVLLPLRDLAIGAIVLPRLRMDLFLAGFDAAETTRFLARFELYFRRAGG
jgi:hypothetical protein